MKPDKFTCQNCGKQIAKGKWCSDKCRMAFKRNPNKSEQKPEHEQPEHTEKGEQTLPEQPTRTEPPEREELSKTDKTFYDRAMKDFNEPYYYFHELPLTTRNCLRCGKEFKTTLRLLRYCSYNHYRKALEVRHADATHR